MPQPVPDRLREVVEACAAGALPPNVALLRLITEAGRPEEVEAALSQALAGARHGPRAREAVDRLADALSLWDANPQAFATIKAVLDGVEHGGSAADPAQGVAQWARAFDRLAEASPEGGVALYALGNPDLLRAATAEVVAWLDRWGLLPARARVVDLGCGIGRLAAALAPRVAHVAGLDVSPGMIARARERCAGLPNVTLAVSSGRDLRGVGDGAADLVLAADVFPYLVQAGGDVARVHVEEAARVLRPGGHLAALNFSYRGDDRADRADVARLADAAGLAVIRAGERDLSLWNAACFLLRRA